MLCHRQSSHAPSVKRTFHRDKLVSTGSSFPGVFSGRFEHPFIGFRPAVGKKHPVHAAGLFKRCRRLSAGLVVKQVRCMQKFFRLLFQSLCQFRMAVSQTAHSDTCRKIQIFPAFRIVKIHALSPVKFYREPVVGVQKRLFCFLHIWGSHFLISVLSHCPSYSP